MPDEYLRKQHCRNSRPISNSHRNKIPRENQTMHDYATNDVLEDWDDGPNKMSTRFRISKD